MMPLPDRHDESAWRVEYLAQLLLDSQSPAEANDTPHAGEHV